MNQRQKSRPEPEIILPGDPEPRSIRATYSFRRLSPFVDIRTSHGVYTARLGPFGFILLGLALVIAAAVIGILLVGAILFWIPILVLLVAAVLISGLLRR